MATENHTALMTGMYLSSILIVGQRHTNFVQTAQPQPSWTSLYVYNLQNRWTREKKYSLGTLRGFFSLKKTHRSNWRMKWRLKFDRITALIRRTKKQSKSLEVCYEFFGEEEECIGGTSVLGSITSFLFGCWDFWKDDNGYHGRKNASDNLHISSGVWTFWRKLLYHSSR